jgi:hypothetical protein
MSLVPMANAVLHRKVIAVLRLRVSTAPRRKANAVPRRTVIAVLRPKVNTAPHRRVIAARPVLTVPGATSRALAARANRAAFKATAAPARLAAPAMAI